MKIKFNLLDTLVFLYLCSLTLVLNTPLWFLADVLLFILLFSYLVNFYVSKRKILLTKSFLWHTIFLILSIMSVLWTKRIEIYPLFSILHINIAILLLTNYLKNNGVNNYISMPFFISGMISTISVWQLYGPIFLINQGTRINTAMLLNSNTYAILLLVITLVLGSDLVFNNNSRFKNIFYVLMLINVVYQNIFLTGSRKGLVSVGIILIFIMIYYLLINANYLNKKTFINLLIGTLLLLPGIFFGFRYFSELGLFNRITNIFDFFRGQDIQEQSVYIRSRMIEIGIGLFKQRPFFGWGLDQFKYLSGYGVYSHSNYVEVLVSLGGVGLLLLYNTIFTLLNEVIKLWKFLPLKNKLMVLTIISIVMFNDIALVSYYDRLYWFLITFSIGLWEYFKNEELN
ncbi:O-antigen ligase family protein [Aerococcus urinaeequi]|uniref:O-antigen ligase family protein n=1 Tax=Aerococcus urinaeequi TaxID=51665 RepID=A0AA47J2Z4_9LACT|nr:O-antigen ligase family protein [Aerococcus urinaeequi]WAT23982.1 O-antigen ligase family protein [Aerococcus urinaeequi]